MSGLVDTLLLDAGLDRSDLLLLVSSGHYVLSSSHAWLTDDDLRNELGGLIEGRHGGPSGGARWLFETHFARAQLERIANREWRGRAAYRCKLPAVGDRNEPFFRTTLAALWAADQSGRREEIEAIVGRSPTAWFPPVGAVAAPKPVPAKPTGSTGSGGPRERARAIVDSVTDEAIRFHVEHADFSAWYAKLGTNLGFAPKSDSSRDFASRVVGVALDLQRPMFLRGLEVQRPLRLADVAEPAGHHDSTISRVMQHMEIEYRGEVMPASVLFSNALGDEGIQASISGAQARVALLSALAAHPAASDEALTGILGRWGIPISRRTIAKYRGPDDLGVPSSSEGPRTPTMIAEAITRLAPTEWLRALAARRIYGIQDEVDAGHEVHIASPPAAEPASSVGSELELGQTLSVFPEEPPDAADAEPDELPGEPLPPWRTQVRFELSAVSALPVGLERTASALFEHQMRAVEALRAWWPEPGARGVLCLPTGAGKSRTAVSFLLASAVPRSRVLWLAHRAELIDQAIATFAAVSGTTTSPFSVGRYQAGPSKVLRPTDVVVASIPTVARRFRGELRSLERLWRQQGGFDIVVIDECHHSAARSWRAVVDWIVATAPTTRLLGLSATPTRADQREAALLWRLFRGVIHEEPVPPLIEAGVLARPHVVIVPTAQTFEATAAERELFETFDELPATLVRRIAEDSLRQEAVVRTWQDRRTEWKATLVFAATVAQAANLAARLGRVGARAAAVSADTGDVERAGIVERLRRGELDVVVNCGLFTEGTDIPGISTVFLARPTRSRVLFQQMVGRAMRGPRVGGSPDCNVVAFCDSVTGLMSQMLASTFANEQEALAALGLEEREAPAPSNGETTGAHADVDLTEVVRALERLVGSAGLVGADRESLVGWWEARHARRRRFLPIFAVDEEAAAGWVPRLRAETSTSAAAPAFQRVAAEVAERFGELAARTDATIKFVRLSELAPPVLESALRQLDAGTDDRPAERVVVQGLERAHELDVADHALLVRAWSLGGDLLAIAPDRAALDDFVTYVRGLGTAVATDDALRDIVAAAAQGGSIPAAGAPDPLSRLDRQLAATPDERWSELVRQAAAEQALSTEDLLLDLLERAVRT